MPTTKPVAGQVWEGRSKRGNPVSRRRIVAVLPTGIQWEPVGLPEFRTKPVVTMSTWESWARRLVNE